MDKSSAADLEMEEGEISRTVVERNFHLRQMPLDLVLVLINLLTMMLG